mgnify:FL=1
MGQRGILGLVVLVGLVGVLMAGCTGSAGKVPIAEASVAQAAVPRVSTPEVPARDLEELAAGNSAFAFDLYGALRAQDGNLFYSPYSVSLALALAYAGARGDTEQQMAKTLHYTLPQERLHPAFNALDQQLANRGSGAKGQDGKGFRLKIANSLWGQTGYQFLPQYLETLASNYGAGLRLTDFVQAPEPARLTINDWVKGQTEGKIPDLLPQGVIDHLTRLVLVNAVYFNAAWQHPFEKANTHTGPFTLLDGSHVEVPMMSQTENLAYTRGEGYQAVELPYDGGDLSMVIMLPESGTFQQFESSLTGERVKEIMQDLRSTRVALTLPKFTYQSSFGLAGTLSAMGMSDAMNPERADFSGISGNRDLYIKDVIHRAVVTVDEQGTEAAAATAVIIGIVSAPTEQPVLLTVDRPFVFLIRDVQSGTVLFVGRVVNPAG